jgi:hypothetical protein
MSARVRKRNPNCLPLDQRLSLTVENSAQALDIGKSKVWELIKQGKLQAVSIDGMTRVTADSLRALVDTTNK